MKKSIFLVLFIFVFIKIVSMEMVAKFKILKKFTSNEIQEMVNNLTGQSKNKPSSCGMQRLFFFALYEQSNT